MGIIEALQQNKMAFGLMETPEFTNAEMQAEAREIGIMKISLYTKNVDGDYEFLHWCARQHGDFRINETYQLPDHYKEDAGVEKVPIQPPASGMPTLTFNKKDAFGSLNIRPLYAAPEYPDFIGYLYEDGAFSALPRRYRRDDYIFDIRPEFAKVVDYTVLTPTHVLFRGKS
jgi:hypothetical protein